MNAFFQKILVIAQCAAALGWLLWHWPKSTVLAIVGALAILFCGLLWMAFQCVWMARVNATTPDSPPAGWTQVLAAGLAEAAVASAVFGWLQPFRSQAEPDFFPAAPARDGDAHLPGVLLLHGFACNRGLWNPWLRRLRAQGRACMALTLEPVGGSIDEYVGQIDAAVRRLTAATGRTPLVLAHSMGGLAARAWLQAHPDGCERVLRIITLGTPHQGTETAALGLALNARQMRRQSPWLTDLARRETVAQRALFTCWASNCDSIVFPSTTAHLDGARNRWALGWGHMHLVYAPPIIEACMAEIQECSPL